MENRSRFLVLTAATLLLCPFFLPLWQIVLEAPQYPEGLGMKIWLTGITGNLDQINGLNHYIGMRLIRPDDFWEFRVVPFIYGGLVLAGYLTALLRKKWLLRVWAGSLILFAIAGFTDFYLWEYEYGHHLDPRAAIKVEGMSYQPPLIGYKQLLNFLAGSFPDSGGWAAGLGGAIVLFVLVAEHRTGRSRSRKAAAFCATAVVLSACGSGPEPLRYGADVCEHCRMMIMDPKYGAEIVTAKGRIFKFDAAECMVNFLRAGSVQLSPGRDRFLTIDMASPGNLIDAKTAFYLKDRAFQSPMGGNLASFASRSLAENNHQHADGRILTWNELLELKHQ